RELGPAPVLLVPVVRESGEPLDDHVRDTVADLARGRAERIELLGLDRSELVELIHDRIPAHTTHDVGAVAEALLRETAGNPLLADQLLAHWHRDGRLRTDADTEALVVDTQVTDPVPATVRDLVWHRIGLLGEGAAPALTAAAVLGLEFDERI